MEKDRRLGFEKSAKSVENTIGEEEEDFEFAFSIESDPGSLPEITADEIFYNGRILPAYPFFNRDLIESGNSRDEEEEEKLAEEVEELVLEYKKLEMMSRSAPSSSSALSEAANLERLRKNSQENFIWVPKSLTQSPDRWRKSSSTGSSTSSSVSRKWKLRDLVVGRSRSDGKESFVAIPLPAEKTKTILNSSKPAMAEVGKKEKGGKGKEMDIVTAHRIYYGKVGSGGGQPPVSAAARRSFLPYRQELLGGIFGNSKNQF